jgi:hypothetical protein
MQGGQPGTGFNYVPASGGLMQSMTSTDGTNTNTTVGVDPSMAANTTQTYDPATNTLTTTTVDPATGAGSSMQYAECTEVLHGSSTYLPCAHGMLLLGKTHKVPQDAYHRGCLYNPEAHTHVPYLSQCVNS